MRASLSTASKPVERLLTPSLHSRPQICLPGDSKAWGKVLKSSYHLSLPPPSPSSCLFQIHTAIPLRPTFIKLFRFLMRILATRDFMSFIFPLPLESLHTIISLIFSLLLGFRSCWNLMGLFATLLQFFRLNFCGSTSILRPFH